MWKYEEDNRVDEDGHRYMQAIPEEFHSEEDLEDRIHLWSGFLHEQRCIKERKRLEEMKSNRTGDGLYEHKEDY